MKKYDEVFARLDELCRFFCEHQLLSHASLYNVNVPEGDKPILITRQGGYYFTDEFLTMMETEDHEGHDHE